MRTLKLTVAYDGTDFAGWQMQDGPRTVQGVLEDALRPIAGTRVVIHAAGRTDAGVHATGQVISFVLASAIPCDALLRAMNVRLPPDVRVMDAAEAADGFHARFHACRKTYCYTIYNAPVALPQVRHFAWHLALPLDVDAMNDAASRLVGEHDFAAFQAAGGDVLSTRRHIVMSRVTRSAAEVRYEVAGNGFLRHMVRNMVGTLVDIGRGRRPVTDITRVLASRDRGQASATAPPHGLTLVRVEY